MFDGSEKEITLLRDLVAKALELPADSRLRFVRQRTGGDADIEGRALRLLASAEKAIELEVPVGQVAEEFVGEALGLGRVDQPNDRDHVGPYRLLRKIGEGGMGSVYLGERADGSFKRQVAIKFVRDIAASQSMLERFRAEEQILAGLAHPGIATIYSGGVSDDGIPYFAMEYVDGEPITAYANRLHLSIPDRLQLFCKVCDAVSYAQRNLVVHRDLKPGHIVVTADGTVKLLDFGIAKVVEPDSADATLSRTSLLTPNYAAPEQLTGRRVTTATDVYSLGVVLFELLTGVRPYATHLSYAELISAICDRVPVAPSRRVLESEHGSESIVGGESQKRARELRGDLDTIVLKALRKDPEDRYPNAEALEKDIRRYLTALPIEARRATLSYRLRRFVVRHRTAVIVSAIVSLCILVLLSWLGIERATALSEKRRADSVTRLLSAATGPSIDFLDTNVGFRLGNGVLSKTVDGGNTWTVHTIDLDALSFDFRSESTGWATALSTIRRTEDGGRTWNVEQEFPDDYLIKMIQVTDNGIVWAAGQLLETPTPSGRIVRLGERGRWEEVYSGFVDLHTESFFDTKRGIAAGQQESMATILLTTDGGATWKQHTVAGLGDIMELHALDDSTVFFVAVEDGGNPSSLFSTTDGLKSWSRLKAGITSHFVVDHRTILATDGDSIFKTSDGGSTWIEVLSGTKGLTQILLVDGSTGWAAGSHTGGATLFKTNDGGNSWIDLSENIRAIGDPLADSSWRLTDQ